MTLTRKALEATPLPNINYRHRQGRKGQPCEVVVRGKVMNSCLVRFADGYTMVTSRNAIRRAMLSAYGGEDE